MPLQTITSIKEMLEKAKQAEEAGELEQSAGLYKQVIQEAPTEEYAYNRLMIVYRKLKKYKDELKVVNAGIKAFENLYKTRSSNSKNRKIAEISNALLKSTGLADKKGNHLYDPEPLGKWKKRKVVIEKKIK